MSAKSLQYFQPNLFKGKVAFVTGGGSGICKGMTEALMTHGADAVIMGRRENVIKQAAAELSKTTGQQCLGVAGDVRKPEDLKRAVQEAIAKFGRLDIVIAGAAGNFLSKLSGLSESAFATVVAIDLLGTYNTIKATLPEIKKTKGSYIAVTATLHYRGTPLQGHVSAAKAGVDALFRVMSVELGPLGIRCNTIAPGPIAGTEGMSRLAPEGLRGTVESMTPLQRQGEIAEIGYATIFLSAPTGAYISGTTIVVDGGNWHTSSLGTDSGLYPELFKQDIEMRELLSKL
ncbi:peroxisomal 2 4-dienoyl-CoA reductase sps19 [Microbotryomycetes sp. JL201]|nr:peroxisomal 2 4-dienoyl-CoA reductase sps19 [Microbotryomycetes sp. JL201]